MGATFYFRSKDDYRPRPLYAHVVVTKNGQRVLNLKTKTRLVAIPAQWNEFHNLKNWNKIKEYRHHNPDYAEFQDKVDAIKMRLDDCGEDLSLERMKEIINSVIDYKANTQTTATVTDLNEGQIVSNKKKQTHSAGRPSHKGEENLMAYINRYVDTAKQGFSIVSNDSIARNTGIAIQQAMNKFREFNRKWKSINGRNLDFDDMNQDVFNQFVIFLQKQNYHRNSIVKCAKTLRTVMRHSMSLGLHSNNSYLNYRYAGETADAIYLTRDDLKAMMRVDLSSSPKGYEVARDIFMVGCWTAQRISDYANIKPTDIKKDANGVSYIKFVQKKTGVDVSVPTTPELRAILGRYPDGLPTITNQLLNSYIKEIGRMAGLDEPIKTTSTVGGKKVEQILPKYSLIHSHTARRTGASLMYLSGEFDAVEIMRITGHKSVSMLQKYIKASDLDNLQKLSSKHYFSGE